MSFMKVSPISWDAEKYLLTKCLNRRASNFFPGCVDYTSDWLLICFPSNMKLMQRLYKLEADKFCGCIKISCEKTKSRSALLVLRGRALACIYGEKSLPQQIVGERAYQHILGKVLSETASMDVFAMDERLVLAASSVFQGKTMKLSDDSAAFAIEQSLAEFAATSELGSIIVVNPEYGVVGIFYVDGREIICCSSFIDELQGNTCSAIADYIMHTPNLSIIVSHAVTDDVQILMDQSSSLSGLKAMISNRINPLELVVPSRLDESRHSSAKGKPNLLSPGHQTKSLAQDFGIVKIPAKTENSHPFKTDTWAAL